MKDSSGYRTRNGIGNVISKFVIRHDFVVTNTRLRRKDKILIMLESGSTQY